MQKRYVFKSYKFCKRKDVFGAYYSNTLTDPRTMMIKSLNTVVADGAVRCTGRAIK